MMSSELPGRMPVLPCRQGYMPVSRPKRDGVLVDEVA